MQQYRSFFRGVKLERSIKIIIELPSLTHIKITQLQLKLEIDHLISSPRISRAINVVKIFIARFLRICLLKGKNKKDRYKKITRDWSERHKEFKPKIHWWALKIFLWRFIYEDDVDKRPRDRNWYDWKSFKGEGWDLKILKVKEKRSKFFVFI